MHKYRHEYYLKNKKKENAQSRNWAKKNPKRYKLITKRSHLKIRYGISLENFNLILKNQNYKCAICQSKLNLEGQGAKSCSIDHDHQTGKIRGLLCHSCNSILGSSKEEYKILEAASKYLKEWYVEQNILPKEVLEKVK